MKIVDINPVVYSWCRNHGLSVLDPDAEFEFGLWCEELDLNADVNDNALTSGYDLEELIWRLDVELENEILREEFYDSYAEFLNGPYVEWCEEVLAQTKENKMKVYAVEYNPNFDGSSVWSVQ